MSHQQNKLSLSSLDFDFIASIIIFFLKDWIMDDVSTWVILDDISKCDQKANYLIHDKTNNVCYGNLMNMWHDLE